MNKHVFGSEKVRVALFLLLFLTFKLKGHSQDFRPNYLQSNNEYINRDFEIVDSSGWFLAFSESNVLFSDFLNNYKIHLGLGNNDSFALKRVTYDDYPFLTQDNRVTHHRYNPILS